MNPFQSHLLALAEAYATHRGISLWRLGVLVAGRSSLFIHLKKGRDCRTDTYLRALQWFSDNWPEPPEWPADIPRPVPTHHLDEAA